MLDEILYSVSSPAPHVLFPGTSHIGNRDKAGFIIIEGTSVFYSAIGKLVLLSY